MTMPDAAAQPARADEDLNARIARACERIAPAWPLDRLIAVNPFWGFCDLPFPETAARIQSLRGSRLLMPRAWYREQLLAGRFGPEHLRRAASELGSRQNAESLLALLGAKDELPPRRALLTDVADAPRDLARHVAWTDFVRNNISQLCASYFADHGALASTGAGALHATWLAQSQHDHGPRLLMGLRAFRELVESLPREPLSLITAALLALDVPVREQESYLTALLLDVNGWASACSYRRWTARLSGADDPHLLELLAIRLGWEWVLLRAGGPSLAKAWQMAMARWTACDAASRASLEDDWVFQRALELAHQDRLCVELARGLEASAPTAPLLQAAFCIDVRSEIFRRALEAQSPQVQTMGVAGFFGLPIAYAPSGSEMLRPQLPGLLAPKLRADDGPPGSDESRRSRFRLALGATWGELKKSAPSGFPFVEALGLTYAAKLVKLAFGRDASGTTPGLHKPRLVGSMNGEPLSLDARCDLAAGLLRAMGLTSRFAPLVLLVGHGSSSANNPHAAALDCGACCGQSGEVNSRLAAALLNDPEVRAALKSRGIDVPATTHFVGALHDTTRDEVTLFDTADLPESAQRQLGEARAMLAKAGEKARSERAPALGLAGRGGEALRAALDARAGDAAQTRPEWGLAGNTSFFVGPREHNRHMNLEGRAFLHEYRWQDDPEATVLEQILGGPMVVTHWINMQYYASTVDNLHYGSGNKVLHNVVGGHLGVFEGNGGDLRIGLSWQSVHDGTRFVHSPLRLSVFVEAPRAALAAILRKHAHLRQLVENGWLYLFQVDAESPGVHAWRDGNWAPVSAGGFHGDGTERVPTGRET